MSERKMLSKEGVFSHGTRFKELKGQRGIVVCKTCQNIYYDKAWFDRERFFKSHTLKGEIKYATCPACESKKSNYPEGIVKLSGDFLFARRDEIINSIRGIEKRQLKNKPLDRIIDIDEGKREWTVTTTCKELAVAIGKGLERAFKGDLKIKWTKGEDLVRIEWKREK